jgi:hypothetical protein
MGLFQWFCGCGNHLSSRNPDDVGSKCAKCAEAVQVRAEGGRAVPEETSGVQSARQRRDARRGTDA